MKVAIVGAGLIGRAWAMVFARGGWDVAVYDLVDGAADACVAECAHGLATLAEHGLCDDPEAALGRLVAVATLGEALEGAAYVQESGPERLEVKLDLFAELDRLAGADTILASSTSALQCSLFTEALPGRARCLVAHPVNPPHLAPVVELSGAPWTDEAVVAKTRAMFEALGQKPITVKKEVDGFILNRLQAALVTEAFRLVGEGYVSPEDLDKTITDGLGLRWSFIGPFQVGELNAPAGLADYIERYSPFFRRVAETSDPDAALGVDNLARCVEAWGSAPSVERVAEMSRWRDKRLAALAAHKKSQE
ncbi:3-hydroxyacyl-CoA dehydrogenase [Acuticoccus sp. I52.16.1]|uniref:3-hydroxyacyl-CoA dehydrogenase n=1 Tax=Acuticoccus sp. I52.16.1 TaxID=2928472 RepID=UPI001FD07E49|nr:3-hydroxyacyl-CoA dehydrogenase [Acuticoccus sp. I52.16.1]UOM33283.1 3-hydroxyacyl-CoA dehydrogenase [Acuticoccus sp. I52.16.1]